MRRPGVLVALVLIVPVLVLGIGYLAFHDVLQQQAVAPEPPVTQVVDDGLDAPDPAVDPLPTGWERIAVDENNAALVASGDAAPLPYGTQPYGDVAVEVRWWAAAGQCRVSVRAGEGGEYTLGLSSDSLITLYRDATEIGSDIASSIISGPAWHRLRLSVMGNVLRVAADGDEGISVTDPDPLPPGGIVLSVGDGAANCTIDHVSVWVPANTPAE